MTEEKSEEKFIVKLINMFFGRNNKTRFIRAIIFIVTLAIFIMLWTNLRYTGNSGVEWGSPTVNINK